MGVLGRKGIWEKIDEKEDGKMGRGLGWDRRGEDCKGRVLGRKGLIDWDEEEEGMG